MADYRSVPVKFQNKGVIQRVDSDFLTDGQFYDLLNSCSIHEGAISSRYGSTRKSAAIGSLIHTLEVFRIGATAAQQYMYVGEGTEIYRLPMNGLGGAPTALNAALPSWGQRWNATKFNAGLAGKPYFFVSASKMLKDRAVTSNGSLTTDFEKWGIIPPYAALSAAVDVEISKAIYSGIKSVTWTVAGSQSNIFMGDGGVDTAIALTSTPVDLSQFSSTVPSGKAVDGYDSDDLIEITFTMKNQERFDQFILELDTNAGTYLDYYRKVIVPRQTSANTTYNTQLVVADDGSGSVKYVSNTSGIGDQDIQLPASATNDSGSAVNVVLGIRKSDFQKIGKAGTTGYTWADIKDVRLWAKSSNLGAVDVTLGVTLLRMVGGSGPDNSAPGASPYEYTYTYRNDATGHESNPAPLMVSDRYVKDVKRRGIVISGFTSPADTQVSSYAIYRRGGTIGNDFRLVGYTPQGDTDYTDILSDDDLQYAKSLEFDNDPPVTSKMPTALDATFTGTGAAGTATVSLTVLQPYGVLPENCLTVGTRLLVQDNERTEYVQISAVSGSNITVNFQVAHSGTVKLVTSSIVGVPCRLSTVAGTSVFLAGDQNNPHYLYKSKSGRPESFPVVVEATGVVNQMPVGSPSNPIMGLTEYNGECICLNRHNIFTVRVVNGQMSSPQETPAQRGLVCDGGWCKADNELFYLADDGVYSWSGGASQKRSGQIDWFFRGQTVNGRAPMDRTEAGLAYVKFCYHQNDIHMTCRDTNGDSIKWVYSTIYDRWEPHTPAIEGLAYAAWTTLLSHQGTLYSGRLLTGGSTNAYVYEENVGTSDNGYAIPFLAKTGFYSLSSPAMQKQWGDIVVELTSEANLDVAIYYDFSGSATETFTITGASGRRRVPLPFNSGSAKEAYAIGFKFSGNADTGSQTVLHSITFSVFELAEIQRGKANDWSDWGYPHDKRLDQLVIEYDTGGASVTLNLDTISGISGNTQSLGVSTFTLTGTGRSKATLPIKAAADSSMVVAKMVRLRPTTTSADFKIFFANITFERYPADITLFTDPNDYGNPYSKLFQQMLLDVDTGGVTATVGVYLDNATTPSQTFTVTTNARNRQYNPTMDPSIRGKKARLQVTPGVGGKFQLFSHNFIHVPDDKGPVMHTYDWDDLGYRHDKRLTHLSLEYDTAGLPVTIMVDVLTGIEGKTQNLGITSFTLNNNGRATANIPLSNITDNTAIICKMVKIRPADTDVDLRIYKADWGAEKYPPDVTLFTEPSEYGNPFDKYFQQLVMDIDTGGVDCTVAVYIDSGASVAQSFTVNTNRFTRQVNLVMKKDLMGKKAWMRLTPGANGKAQLFTHNFVAVPADKGAVLHSYDWDDLGTPNDKRLQTMFIEYEVTAPCVIAIEGLSGISGNQSTSQLTTHTLTPSGRKKDQISFPDGTVVKMIRVHPSDSADPPTDAKIYKYEVIKEVLPQDKTPFTPASDLGYKCDKVFRTATIDIDTGGVDCTAVFEVDGVDRATFTLNSSQYDRVRTVSFTSDIDNTVVIGRLVRWKFTPGTGGKSQLFNIDYNATREPCPMTFFDSFEQYFGSNGYKYMKQVWMEYRSTGPIRVSVYRDNGMLFYSVDLPQHTQRDVSRFYLPAVNGIALNKSYSYRITIEGVSAATVFYLYRDSSRIETMLLSGDSRAPYAQHYLFAEMPIAK